MLSKLITWTDPVNPPLYRGVRRHEQENRMIGEGATGPPSAVLTDTAAWA